MTIRKIRKCKLTSAASSLPPLKRQSTVTIEQQTPGGFGSISVPPNSRASRDQKSTSFLFSPNPPAHAFSFGTPSQTNTALASPPQVNGTTPTAVVTISDDDSDSDSDLLNVVLDMDAHSCADALDSLTAYYKVARKIFIDNVAVQVVNRHVMRGLEDVFSPLVVAGWSDETVRRAGAESNEVARERVRLGGKLDKLKAGKEVFT